MEDDTRLPFSNLANNRRLEKHVIKTSTVAWQTECEDQCYEEFNCKSINVKGSICELNDELRETKPGDFRARSGWAYKSTNHNTKMVSFSCFSFSTRSSRKFGRKSEL